MIGSASAICIAGWVACVIAAAVSDARTLSIPNVLSIGIFGLFMLYAGSALTLDAALTGLGVGAATLGVGFFAFTRGWIGGGDAKLLAACMMWAGLDNAPLLLAVTGVAGGVLALGLISPYAARATMLLQRDWPPQTGGRARMPYGVAIAAGALTVAVRIAA